MCSMAYLSTISLLNHNIPQNRRRELLIASGGGFRPETSFVKDNTRDDGLKTANYW